MSWTSYEEGLPEPCFTGKAAGNSDDGKYTRAHNPFISFDDIRTNPERCARIVDGERLDADMFVGVVMCAEMTREATPELSFGSGRRRTTPSLATRRHSPKNEAMSAPGATALMATVSNVGESGERGGRMGALMLVHGLAHGSWCWSRTKADLTDRGHEVVAVDLPLTGLDDDAAAVRGALDDWGQNAVLVGHSYAGLVISKAAAGRRDVQHLVYVAAMVVDGGDVYLERMSEFPAAPINSEVELSADGNFVVRPETAVECFYNECDRNEAAVAARRLRPTAAACVAVPTGAEPWTSIPSTYVLCERDRAIHPDFQRWMSTRAAEVVTLDTDHSPFMSLPDRLADLLDGIACMAKTGRAIT
jgi:pimeloyl-ACP methyl ester carboxylesterase